MLLKDDGRRGDDACRVTGTVGDGTFVNDDGSSLDVDDGGADGNSSDNRLSPKLGPNFGACLDPADFPWGTFAVVVVTSVAVATAVVVDSSGAALPPNLALDRSVFFNETPTSEIATAFDDMSKPEAISILSNLSRSSVILSTVVEITSIF